MYQRFYGLRELPFELTPNPRFLFMTPRHREALTTLEGQHDRADVTLYLASAGLLMGDEWAAGVWPVVDEMVGSK